MTNMLTLAATLTAVAAFFWASTSMAQQSEPVLQSLSPFGPDFTTQPAADDSQREARGKMPWWWWIAVVVGSSVMVVVFMSVCVCLCCRLHRRRRQRHCKEMPENNAEYSDDPASHSGGVFLRRLDSTSAKRYLRNLVSVFSWGSDFDPEPDEPKAYSPNPSPRGSQVSFTGHLYVNPDSLGIEGRDVSSPDQPPPRPPRKNEVNHYLNVSCNRR